KSTIFADCREHWPPVPPAIHVDSTSWKNDDVMAVDSFIHDGIKITLDAEPFHSSVENSSMLANSPTMIVTVELPFNLLFTTGPKHSGLTPALILDGTAGVNSN